MANDPTTEEALKVEFAYRELLTQAPDLATKNRIYREFRAFTRVGKVGRSITQELLSCSAVDGALRNHFPTA